MKNLKKLLSLALVIALSLICFAGCNNEDSKNAENSDGEAIEEVMNAYWDLNPESIEALEDAIEEAEEYLDPDGKEYEEKTELADEIDELVDQLTQQFGDEEIGTNIYNAIISNTKENLEHEIIEVDIDGDKATVEYEVTEISDSAAGELIANAVQIGVDYANANRMTQAQYDSKSGRKQVFQACEDDIIDMIEEYVDDKDNLETKTKKATLKKIDGKWLINKIK